MTAALLQAAVPGGVELLLVLLFTLLPAIVGIAVSVLVYRDASRRNSDHALAWGLGAFFGGIVVWILYAVVRDEIGHGGM
jgi:hypothetical protein